MVIGHYGDPTTIWTLSPVGFKIWKILNLRDEPLGESEEQYRRDTVVSL